MSQKVKESDWKLFRDSLTKWRERYLKEKNEELLETIQKQGESATERFWNTKEKMDEEARLLQQCFDGFSRSNMFWHVLWMYGHNIIDDEDLQGFSEELQERIRRGIGE